MIYLVSRQTFLFSNFKIISLEEAINLLNPVHILGLDTETSGLSFLDDTLYTIQIGNADFQIIFDLEMFNYSIPEKLKEFLQKEHLFILHNAKFDLKFLYNFKCIPFKVYDTFLAETILTNGLQFGNRGLSDLVAKYCPGEYMDKSVRDSIIKKGIDEAAIHYGAKDVKFLETIMNKQMKKINQLHMQKALDIDNSFVKVLAYIEHCGIKLDTSKWKQKVERDLDALNTNRQILFDWLLKNNFKEYFSHRDLFTGEAICTLNWASSKQVVPLFEKIGIKCDKLEKGVKKKSVDEKTLDPQKDNFEIIPLYLAYKEQEKLVSTYGDSWFSFIAKQTGRIHTVFKQLMDTGRLSCGQKDKKTGKQFPNLQNVPSDDFTRSCFIVEEGHSLICADFSGQEQIVLANFCKDDALLAFYAKGFSDMHSYVTLLMYIKIRIELGISTISEITNEHLKIIKKNYDSFRTKAKSAAFAINYGGNGSTVAKNCKISKEEGDFVYNSYFEAFAGLRDYFQACFNMCNKYGYLEFNPITGRKYFWPITNPYFENREFIEDPNSKYAPGYKAILQEYNKSKNEIQRISQNYRIQGTAADISKLAGIYIMSELIQKNLLWKVKIVNMIHDEYLVECPDELVDVVADIVKRNMIKAGQPFCKIVPLGVGVKIGKHWLH